MQILHEPEAKRFAAYADDGKEIGSLEFEPDGGVLSANHTWTDPEFRGQGIAGKMLDALACYAQERGFKIKPVCPYVKDAFEKDPDRFQAVSL